jgi:hypothetical protein
VRATAISTGKNSIITGDKIVPNPNPEKNVRIAVRKAVMQIITISIIPVCKDIFTASKISGQ